MNNDLQIPEPKPISSTNPIPVPFVIVGDEAFGQTDKIMRPFGGSNLTTKKKYLIIGFLVHDAILNVHSAY